MKRKVTVHLDVWFQDMDVVSHDDALETVKSVLYDLHHKCQEQVSLGLEELGAKNVELRFTAY